MKDVNKAYEDTYFTVDDNGNLVTGGVLNVIISNKGNKFILHRGTACIDLPKYEQDWDDYLKCNGLWKMCKFGDWVLFDMDVYRRKDTSDFPYKYVVIIGTEDVCTMVFIHSFMAFMNFLRNYSQITQLADLEERYKDKS